MTARSRFSPPFISRGIVVAVAALAVVGAGTLAGRFSRVPETIATPAPSPPRPIPKALRIPFGALTYRTSEHGRTLATISLSGDIRVCLKGSERLRILDVMGGIVLYADGDLLAVPQNCAKGPELLASLQTMLGRAVGESDEFGCAKFSPDGARISLVLSRESVPDSDQLFVGAWNGLGGDPDRAKRRNEGLTWHRLRTLAGCAWIDRSHLLGNGISPWALSLETGRSLPLSKPALWLGSRSPDGSRSIFDLSSVAPVPAYETNVVVDRRTGAQRRIRAAPEADSLWAPEVSIWAPHLSRFLTTDGDRVYVSDETGRLRFSQLILPGTTEGKDANVSWLDDRRIWVGSMLSGIIDTEDGSWHGVTLPGWVPDPEIAPPESGHDLQVFSEENREGTLETESSSLEPSKAPLQRIGALGLTFRRPPDWRIVRCSCTRFIHRAPAFTFAGAPRFEGPFEVPGWMAFSVTNETVGHYIRRLSAEYGVGRTQMEDEESVALRRSPVRLGGVTFESLRFGFWEGAQQLYLGRVGARTIVIEIEPGYEDDPWLRLILDSLKFDR